MRRDRTLIEEKSFEHEGFTIDGEVYEVTLWEKYSSNTQQKYAIELSLEDITGYTHTYTDTIPKKKIGEKAAKKTILDRLLGRDPVEDCGAYESLYEFVVDSVLDATDEALEEQLDTIEGEDDSPEKQAELAFESLSEI